MKQDGSIALFQYWNRLRGRRAAPGRTEIEPADIKALLADTFILELDARGEPVFRLAGTRLCSAYGRELKGFSFPSLWQSKDQRLVRKLTRSVFEASGVVVIEFTGISRGGREAAFEVILLPLEGGREHLRALGSAVAMERNFWLGADPIESNRIESVRMVDDASEPSITSERSVLDVPPLAPDSAMLEDENGIPAARRVRHLVVFEGGRSS